MDENAWIHPILAQSRTSYVTCICDIHSLNLICVEKADNYTCSTFLRALFSNYMINNKFISVKTKRLFCNNINYDRKAAFKDLFPYQGSTILFRGKKCMGGSKRTFTVSVL